MITFWVLALMAAPLSFSITRIAIRLQQQPGLAALMSALICWQIITLLAGQAALAGAIALLMAASCLLALTQWLQQSLPLGRIIRGTFMAMTGALWGYASLFPILEMQQALAFLAALIAVALGAGVAVRRARAPAPAGNLGFGSLGLMLVWLIIRSMASFFAAPA